MRHAHDEARVFYHRTEAAHVHLVCKVCGNDQSVTVERLSEDALTPGRDKIFTPDFTHFSISGTCGACKNGG